LEQERLGRALALIKVRDLLFKHARWCSVTTYVILYVCVFFITWTNI
jgi:hypothetical protein